MYLLTVDIAIAVWAIVSIPTIAIIIAIIGARICTLKEEENKKKRKMRFKKKKMYREWYYNKYHQ